MLSCRGRRRCAGGRDGRKTPDARGGVQIADRDNRSFNVGWDADLPKYSARQQNSTERSSGKGPSPATPPHGREAEPVDNPSVSTPLGPVRFAEWPTAEPWFCSTSMLTSVNDRLAVRCIAGDHTQNRGLCDAERHPRHSRIDGRVSVSRYRRVRWWSRNAGHPPFVRPVDHTICQSWSPSTMPL